jgi:tetratricopeptide (TPR) repeat protein
VSRLVPSAVAAVVFLGLRAAALGGLEATGSDGAQRLLALRHLPVVLLDSLRAMLLMRPIGPRHLWFEYRGLGLGASLAALLAVAGLALLVWRLRRTSPLLVLAAGVSLLVLAPVALVSTVPGWGRFARYIYLPWAFGACAAVELGMVAARRAGRPARVVLVLVLVLAAWLGLQQVGLHRALQVYSSQEELARAAVAIDPDGPPGHEWLGNIWLERNDLRRALEQYRLAVAGDPSLYRPRLNMAACLLHLGRSEEALEQIDLLEARHGRTVHSCHVAVKALLRLGRVAEAKQRLRWALERAPDSVLLRRLEATMPHGPASGPAAPGLSRG